MASNVENLLTSVDSLFTTQEQRDSKQLEKIINIPSSEIDPFPNHPFKVRMDDEMTELVESVKQFGILVPAIVRMKENGRYEMIAGHRRQTAGELAGINIPCLIRNLTDDEAVIIMVDSNLQREKILPSEKAAAYKMKLEAIKRQGKRNDLTCAPSEHKSENKKARDIVAEEAGESREQIRRYIRLNELIPEILEMVDNDKMAFQPAVELSYLKPQEQKDLFTTMESEVCTPSTIQAKKMKEMSADGKLDMDNIFKIMAEQKPNQKEQFKMSKERLNEFFPPDTPMQKIEETIIKALKYYLEYIRKRQREHDRER